MSLNGTVLHWKDTVKDLGNFISNDLSEDEEIRYKQCDFIGRVNCVCANFKSAPRDVVSKIFTAPIWVSGLDSERQGHPSIQHHMEKPSENCGDCPIWHAQHYCLCLCAQNPSLSKYINALPKCTMKYIKVLMVRCSCSENKYRFQNDGSGSDRGEYLSHKLILEMWIRLFRGQ